MPLGAHLPTSKGFEAALRQAQDLECDCLQIFAKSPRQWHAGPMDTGMAAEFTRSWKKGGLSPLVAHDSYLINLASADEVLREKSIAAMVDEIERCDLLGCDYLVTHCGAHLVKNGGDEACLAGLDRLADSLKACFDRKPDSKTVVCLENTAGQGTTLGGPFEHIARVLEQLPKGRAGVCFDTCHAFSYGHDIVNDLPGVLANFDTHIGLENLRVIHFNDSKTPFGDRKDRHEHIGQGLIGAEAMRAIVRHPSLKKLPFIMETPEMETEAAHNLATVRGFIAG